jgi:RNA-directed DNA polymerase
MGQKFNSPKSEKDFIELQKQLFRTSKEARDKNQRPRIKGLMEIILSEPVIITAIHKIKSNKGSQTAGTDKEIINKYLQQSFNKTINDIRQYAKCYNPRPIRRVLIPKPGKMEKRSLGIPTIKDRIFQECIRLTMEPIMEAQFFNHSYGFRSMRSTSQAIERLSDIAHKTGYRWIIEGDISKYFDTVNHRRLLKRLWEMGIRDRRLLQIIKTMLENGILNECKRNEVGTPQGGILSPLLANIYLDIFDEWVEKQWERKTTKFQYKRHDQKLEALRKRSNINPGYLIRYADDWVLLTDTRESARLWKKRIEHFLRTELKITLSKEKTKITDARRQKITFVGFDYKVVRGKARKGYITRTQPNTERLKAKIREIRNSIKKIRLNKTVDDTIDDITLINSKIRGLINYYETSTWVNIVLRKYSRSLIYYSYTKLKKHGGKWVRAKDTDNLRAVHEKYETGIPAIKVKGFLIGITHLGFATHKPEPLKNQKETPYTQEGLDIYHSKRKKKPAKVRADELFNESTAMLIGAGMAKGIYNFEYFMNRGYAFNRDKGKCKISGDYVDKSNVHIHHKNPKLPINLVNKVNNLITIHKRFHPLIHSNQNLESVVNDKERKKILKLRENLI